MFQVMQLSICPPAVFWQISKYIGLTADFNAEKNKKLAGVHAPIMVEIRMFTS